MMFLGYVGGEIFEKNRLVRPRIVLLPEPFLHRLKFDAVDESEMEIRVRYEFNDPYVGRGHHKDELPEVHHVFQDTVLHFFHVLDHPEIQGNLQILHENHLLDFHDAQIRNDDGVQKMVDEFDEKIMDEIGQQKNAENQNEFADGSFKKSRDLGGKAPKDHGNDHQKKNIGDDAGHKGYPVRAEKGLDLFVGVLALEVEILLVFGALNHQKRMRKVRESATKSTAAMT